jgi:hypothetical protein
MPRSHTDASRVGIEKNPTRTGSVLVYAAMYSRRSFDAGIASEPTLNKHQLGGGCVRGYVDDRLPPSRDRRLVPNQRAPGRLNATRAYRASALPTHLGAG